MLRVESCSIDAGLLGGGEGGDRGIFEGMGDKRSNINRGNGFTNQTIYYSAPQCNKIPVPNPGRIYARSWVQESSHILLLQVHNSKTVEDKHLAVFFTIPAYS